MSTGKSKGQFTFLTKGFLMIFMIIAMALIINQITFYQVNMDKISKEYDLSSTAMNLIAMLSNSEKCLGYTEEVTIGGDTTNKTYTRVIDIKKLERFAKIYNETEPECARNYLTGYNVTVETLPLNFTYDYIPPEEITVLQKMLAEIEQRDAMFVIDMSNSMQETVGKIKKVNCVKDFMKNFVDELRSGQSIGLVGYGIRGYVNNEGCVSARNEPPACVASGPNCGAAEIISPVQVGADSFSLKSNIDSQVTASGCTPMAHGLIEGYKTAIKNGINDIILLTDGCENCAGDSLCVAQKYASTGIRVHTIAFGESICGPTDDYTDNCVCNDKLESISEATGGQNFIARNCEELIRPPNVVNAAVEKTKWTFGATGHSVGSSLEGEVSLSLPVVIKKGKELLPGFIKLSLYRGDLESVSGLIDYVCRKKTESTLDTFIDKPIAYYNETKSLCIESNDGTASCRKVDCDHDVDMDKITNPGRYKIYARWESNMVRVIV